MKICNKMFWTPILMVILFIGYPVSPVCLTDITQEKVYCYATVDDDFVDNRVMLVLNDEASYSDKTYDTSFFSNINCLEVNDLTQGQGTEDSNTRTGKRKGQSNRILCLNLDKHSKENVLNVINELIKYDDVLYAGPDYLVSALSAATNDEYCDSQWAIDALKLQDSWQYGKGSSDIVVGILDTGINGSHPDLSDAIATSLCRDFTSGEEVAVTHPTDLNGHGTHVAGIVGAVGNNNTGITGVNWNIRLASLRVLNEIGQGSLSAIAQAITFADNNNIPILNLSLGWTAESCNDFALNSAIESYDGLLICAAGNDNSNNDGIETVFPASFDYPNIISVGSHDQDNNKSDFSNYGKTSVDIYAPGSEIISTFPVSKCEKSYTFSDGTRLCEMAQICVILFSAHKNNNNLSWEEIDNNFSEIANIYFKGINTPRDCLSTVHIESGYHNMDGTSMATPHVSGVAALLLSINPNLTAAQLKSAILNGAETITITLPNPDKITPAPTQVVKKLDAFGAVKQIISGCSTVWGLRYNEHNLSQTVGEGSYFVDNNVMIKLVVRGAGNYKFNMSSTKPLNATLYDSNLNAIDITPTYSSGNCTINLSQYLAFGTYYLRVNFADAADSGKISVTVSHNHIYDDWQYYSHSEHISACKCGKTAFEKRPHIIRSSDIVNYRANCLECHYLLDLREDIVVSPYGSGLKVSVNGSYICPSGIVVLVEEDVDAYFAGTLRFYEQDQLPQQE